MKLTNVLPLTLLLSAALLLVAAVWPDARAQLRASVSREPQGYVALYFTDQKAARTCELNADGTQTVDVTIHSELGAAEDIVVRFSVSRLVAADVGYLSDGLPTDIERQTIRIRPDHDARASFDATVPTEGPYRVQAEVEGRQARIVLNCRTGGTEQ